jgi:adenine deaminase
MSPVSLAEAARGERALHAALSEHGYAYHDPMYTLYFLAADFLPAVRLTPLGVWDVKRGRVLLPSRRR